MRDDLAVGMEVISDDGTTRRGFIAGAAAAAVAASAPAAAAKRKKRKRRHADVVIVGAGMAGLTAARNIVRAGHSAIVLEARHRVGGRVWNHDLGHGYISERGATFVGPTQNRVLAMMSELGIGKFDTYDTGNNVYVVDGARGTWSDTGPTGSAPPYAPILPELALIVAEVDQMATTVPVDAPWSASNAAAWDRQTFEAWLQANTFTQTFRDLTRIASRPIFGAEWREMSLLFVLFYVAASGDEQNAGTFERNFDTRDGGQMWRVVGGSQSIAKKMAAGLHKRVHLGNPVRRIVQTRSGVQVFSDRLIVRAKRAIVAVPPVLAGNIHYLPAMPSGRVQLTRHYPQGALTKVAAVYDRPFWRDAGLTGQAVSTGGPVSATFDDSPVDGSRGIVFGFVGGDNARAYHAMSPAARRAAVINQFVDFFGAQAASPRDFFETIWTDQKWSLGCPVGIPAPGALTAYGPYIRQPVGHIHWAGTETSTYWNGYMDGAVRSGERAAAEVLKEI